MFDICQSLEAMGEDGGRLFFHQLIGVLETIQARGVSHRDLKLENILVDQNLNLKVADFGFATYDNISHLKSKRGTLTYMAPEIKAGLEYDGRQTDIFSCGVILFIVVLGIFPFREAKKDDYYYNLLLNGKYEEYWQVVGGADLSNDFKNLIQRIFSVDGNKRPTIRDLRNEPWLNTFYSSK